MKLVGILPARNEDWILGFSVRSDLMWMDELIVMNHSSTDRTAEILTKIQAEWGDHLTVINQPNPAWMQYEYRQEMLGLARERGATHVAFLDADEVLTGNLLPTIRGLVGDLAPGQCLTLPVPCMWRSILRYRVGEFRYAHDKLTVAFADHPEVHWMVKDGYQHDQRQPYGLAGYVHAPVEGGVMHFQWADWRRATAKHALYQMNHMLRWPERQTAQEIAELHAGVIDETGLELAHAPAPWFKPYFPLLPYLKTGGVPWQETECRRLWKLHGPEKFAGLNLFGVVEMETVVAVEA